MTITTSILVDGINGMTLNERGYAPVTLSGRAWEKNGKRRVYIQYRINGASRPADYGFVDVSTGNVTITTANLHPADGAAKLAAAWNAARTEADGSIA